MLARAMPDIEVTEYDPEQQGKPSADFDWSIYDALLIDYQLGEHEDGISWIESYRGNAGFPPAILMTATGDEYVAVKAIKSGALDYINKSDIDQERIARVVGDAFAARSIQKSAEETTFGEKLRNDESIFRTVKLPNDRTPDGERIGYRFVRLIGQGASSRVYLAEGINDKSTLVLKIMDVASIKEPQALQRFVQEAELVAEVDSPFVVKFLEHGFTKE